MTRPHFTMFAETDRLGVGTNKSDCLRCRDRPDECTLYHVDYLLRLVRRRAILGKRRRESCQRHRRSLAKCLSQSAGLHWTFQWVVKRRIARLASAHTPVPILVYIPESPWYYSLKGRHDRAKQVLQRLNGKVEGYDIEHEYAVIRYDVDRAMALRQASSAIGWLSIFKGVNGRRTWISFFPLACQQFVGIPLVFGNMAYFFQLGEYQSLCWHVFRRSALTMLSAGVADPFLPVVIQSVLLIVFLAVAAFTVHKLGRRFLFLTGATIMLLCNLVMGIIGSLTPANAPPKSTETLIAMSCLWVVAYAMSAGPLGKPSPSNLDDGSSTTLAGWAYVADTATPIYRAKTASFAAAGTCMFGLIFNYTTPIMISPQEANWGIKVSGTVSSCDDR